MRPAIHQICEQVARHFGYVTAEEILSRDRHKSIAEARQLAIWLVRTKLGMSYPEIGREFKLDHTTCISSFRRVERATGMLLTSARLLSGEVVSPRVPALDLVAVGAE